MASKSSAIETYREALSELQNAVNALDMAHALLRDLGWHNYVETGYGPRRQTLQSMVYDADGLLRDAQNIICPECAKPMAESEDCLSGCCPDLVGHVNG
jgi:hypothetical protein